MDKEVFDALQIMLKKRTKNLGQQLTDKQLNRIVIDLDSEINLGLRKINSGGKLADCGSFGCPNSYSCDWF